MGKWEAKPAMTITGVSLQRFVDHMSEQEVKETLKHLINVIDRAKTPQVTINLSAVDELLRKMVE